MIQAVFFCAEGISQAGMLAFQFGAAREREKLAKRVSHRYRKFITFSLEIFKNCIQFLFRFSVYIKKYIKKENN